MNDPKPLLREGATDFERRLLSAALGERPSPRLQAQMRRGIGLTGPLLWAGNVKAMLGTLVGKSVIGAVGLVAAGGLAAAVNHATVSAPATATPATATPATPTPATPTLAAPSPADAPSVPFVDQQRQATPALAPAADDRTNTGVATDEAKAGTAVSERAAVDDDANANDDGSNGQLREEIRLLDQARGALQRGSAKDARSVLDEYRERFPTGILDREANVLLEQTRARGTNHGGLKERGTPQRAH